MASKERNHSNASYEYTHRSSSNNLQVKGQSHMKTHTQQSALDKSPAHSYGMGSPERPKMIINNEYEQEELIGGGSFGHVYRCRHVSTGKPVAVKKFKNKYQTKKKAFDQREIQILKRFDDIEKRAKGAHCPFVMKADQIEYENRKLYIVFEKMDMSLTQYIKKRGRKGQRRLDEQAEVKTLMKQILIGMQYLNEELGILHRDLKPDNIMVNENPLIAKIIDFGTCKDLTVESGPHTSYVSTRWYRAPECVLRSHHYTVNSDIFAAGCVMAEMYLQHPLFPGTSEMDQLEKIFHILGTPKRDQWREGYRLAEKREILFNDYPKRNLQKHIPGIGEEALLSLKYMLKISSQKRGLASDILATPFFKSSDFTPSTQESFSLNSPQAYIKGPQQIQGIIHPRNKSQLMPGNQLKQEEAADLRHDSLIVVGKHGTQLNEVIEENHEEAQRDSRLDHHPPPQKMPTIVQQQAINVDQIDNSALDTIVSVAGGTQGKQKSDMYILMKNERGAPPSILADLSNQASHSIDEQEIPVISRKEVGQQIKGNRYKPSKYAEDQLSRAQLPHISTGVVVSGGNSQEFNNQIMSSTISGTSVNPKPIAAASQINSKQSFHHPTGMNSINLANREIQNSSYASIINEGNLRRQNESGISIVGSNPNLQKSPSNQRMATKQNFYQRSIYNPGGTKFGSNFMSPQNKNSKANFNSTIGFFQINGSSTRLGGQQSQMSDTQQAVNNHFKQPSKAHLKFAQGTAIKFHQGRNSDAQFHGSLPDNAQIGGNNFQVGSLKTHERKHPHHLKISDRLHHGALMLEAVSIQGQERGRSGMTGPMSPSALAGGNMNNTNFGVTVRHTNYSPQHLNNRSPLNQNGSHQKSNKGLRIQLNDNFSTSRSSFKQDFMSPKIQKNQSKLQGSGSNQRIPTITLHNQPFYSPGRPQPKPQLRGVNNNFSSTIYAMPVINGASQSSITKKQGSLPRGHLNQRINDTLESGKTKLQIINQKKHLNIESGTNSGLDVQRASPNYRQTTYGGQNFNFQLDNKKN